MTLAVRLGLKGAFTEYYVILIAAYCGGPIELDTFLVFFRVILGPHQFERAGRRAQTLPGSSTPARSEYA